MLALSRLVMHLSSRCADSAAIPDDSWQINNILRIGCSGYNKPMTSCSAAQMAALEAYGASMRTALAPAIAAPKVGARP